MKYFKKKIRFWNTYSTKLNLLNREEKAGAIQESIASLGIVLLQCPV